MAEHEEYPWPGEFEALLAAEKAPSADWVFNACMTTSPTWYRYASGYRRGAELLFKYLEITGHREHNDLVVYPIIFCWRHHLELTLKYMLELARALSNSEGRARLDKHPLLPLWRELREHLPSLGAPPMEVENVEKTFAYLDGYDASSFSFRYPTDKDGNSTQSSVPTLVNLRTLNNKMQALANWLDAGVCEMTARLDALAEMQSTME